MRFYRKSVPAASFVGLGGKAQVVRLDAQGLGRLDAESLQDLDGGLDHNPVVSYLVKGLDKLLLVPS